MSKILIIEDDAAIAELEKDYLELSDFEVAIESDGSSGAAHAVDEDFDLILLDLMLPGMDGFEICKYIREKKDTPILMVSAKKDDIDKIRGLGLGADDYITKPFNILEVKARIKAIIRRNRRKTPAVQEEPKVIVSGSMRLDIDAKRLYIDDKEIRLTVKEFDILKLLAENPGKIYSREQLLTLIWGTKYPGDARTVDVNVRRLREKIEKNPAEMCLFLKNILYLQSQSEGFCSFAEGIGA